MLATRARNASSVAKTFTRSFATKAPLVPRILDRRENETGPGGRGSDAGVKVAVFGASGMLGRYVCTHLGEFSHVDLGIQVSIFVIPSFFLHVSLPLCIHN